MKDKKTMWHAAKSDQLEITRFSLLGSGLDSYSFPSLQLEIYLFQKLKLGFSECHMLSTNKKKRKQNAICNKKISDTMLDGVYSHPLQAKHPSSFHIV